MKKLILASGSPRRRELMEQIGLDFDVITSNAEEETNEKLPDMAVKELSRLKAEAVFENLSESDKRASAVIGADTIVYADGKFLGKPHDADEAFEMIKGLSGKVHSVYTGVTVITEEQTFSFAEQTKVKVYEMSDEEIKNYIETGDCFDKAGAYGIQGSFAAYVSGIDGDYNNVVGLPAARLYHELKKEQLI